jgi:Zn ribbon nucleic-acid-binding protein
MDPFNELPRMKPTYGYKRVIDYGVQCPVCQSPNAVDIEEDDYFDYMACRSCGTTGSKLKRELTYEITEH